MSGQSAKKKRLGSRRTVSRQKETPAADDSFIAESISAAQHHAAEESGASVSVMLNPTELRLETAQPVLVNRRKLGSSRRHKGRQHGKDSEIDTGPDVREEVEENTRGHNTFETTQMSEATQLESQIEVSHLSEHVISVPSQSTLTVSHEYCSQVMEISPTICPEEALGSRPTRNESKMQLFENEESKENPYADQTSQLTHSSLPSCPVENEQLANISSSNSIAVEDQGLSTVEEIEINKTGSTENNAWSGHLLGNSLTSDSFEELAVLESKTPEFITDKSSAREIIEIKHSLEQPVVAIEEQNEQFNILEGRYAQHSEEVVDELTDERQDVHREENFPQSQILHRPKEETMNMPNTQSKDKVSEHTEVKENPEWRTMSTTAEEKKEELSEGGKHGMSVSSDSSTFTESDTGFQLDECDRSLPGTHKGANESDTLGSEEVKGYHCSMDNVRNKLKDEVQITQKEIVTALLNPERELDDAPHNNTDVTLEQPIDQPGILNMHNLDLIVKNAVDSATKEGSSSSNWQPEESAVELAHVDESQNLGDSSCKDEQTETESGPGENGRMVESSRTQKGRQQLKECEIELSDNTEGGQTSETITTTITTETKKEQSLFGEYDPILSLPRDSTVSSVSAIDYPPEGQNSLLTNMDGEMESAIPECTNILDPTGHTNVPKSHRCEVSVDNTSDPATWQNNVSTDPVQENPAKEMHLTLESEKECDFVADSKELWLNHSELRDIAVGSGDKQQLHHDVKHSDERPVDQSADAFGMFDFDQTVTLCTEDTKGPHHIEGDVNTQTQFDKLKLIHKTFEMTSDDTGGNCENILGNSKEAEIKSTSHHDAMAKSSSDSASKQKHSVPDDPQVEQDLKECNLEPSEWKNEQDHLEHAKKPAISDVDRQRLSSDCTDVLKGNTDDLFHAEKEELFFETAEDKPPQEKVYSKTPQPLVNLATELLQAKSLITSVETVTEGIDKSDPLQAEEHDADVVNTSESTVSDLFANPSGAEWIVDHTQCGQLSPDEPSSILPVEDEALTLEGKVANYSVNEPYVGALTVIAAERSSDEEQTEPEQCVDGAVDSSKSVQKQEIDQIFCHSPGDKNNPGDVLTPETDIKSTEDCLDIVKFSDLGDRQVLSEQNSLEVTNHGSKKPVNDGIDNVHNVQSDVEKTDQDNNGHVCLLQQKNPDPSPGVNQEILGLSQDEFTLTFLEETEKLGKAKAECVNVDAKQMTHFSSEAPLPECSNLTSDQQLIKSDSNEMPDEGLPTLYSVSEDVETDNGTETLKLAERFLGIDSLVDVDPEGREFSVTAEMCSDKSDPGTHEDRCRVPQGTLSSPKEEMTKIREPEEDFNSSQSHDVVTRLQKDHNRAAGMHQSSNSSHLEGEPLLQTLDTNICLEAQPLDTCQRINDETHADVEPARGKRRLGSSRRFRGSQQVKGGTSEVHRETQEHSVETTEPDEGLEVTKMPLEAPMAVQEESDHLKLTEGDDMFFPKNVMKSTALETADFTSNVDTFACLKSSVDTEDSNRMSVEEPRNVRGLTESGPGHMTLIETAQGVESDMLSVSSHDDSAAFTSTAEDVVDQTEDSQTQNTEALACDSDSFGQKIHDAKESQICGGMADGSMDLQGLQLDEVRQKCEDPTEDNVAHGMYVSPQPASAAQMPAEDVPSDAGLSPAMDASNNSESEQSHSGHYEIVQVISTQKKRKLGSTRRSLLRREQVETKVQEETTETHSDVRNLEFEVAEPRRRSQNENVSPASSQTYKELQDADEALPAHGGEHEQRDSGPNVQSTDSHVIPDVNDLLDHFPQRSAANSVSIVRTVDVANLMDEMSVNVTVQPPRIHNFTGIEDQISSERNRQKVASAEMAVGSLLSHLDNTQDTQSDEKPESVEPTEEQQNPNVRLESRRADVEATTNRRRKMGSTRRDLGFQHKVEKLHQHQEEEIQATAPETRDGDETAATGAEERELQLHSENSEDKENIFETVERAHVNESHLEPLAQQSAPLSKPEETEHQLFVSGVSPSTSATMPEPASGGRRRKMGSHRKSRDAQYQLDQSVAGARENTSTEESPSRGEIPEVHESPEKPSPSFSEIKAQDSLRLVSEDSRARSRPANAALNQESRTQPPLVGGPRGEGPGSSGYNVVMIGDSGVGKTSFMKRALSGKFSLTLPSSIGVDTFMWTVVVDGKPVVLHVWDTAGQERFRSITRNVFHRAQAFLLMYDIASPQSFSAVNYWASCIQESGAENVIILLLGNKSDSAQRKVETHQGQILAEECNFGFMECSAATGENVIESLESMARMLSQTGDSRREATVLHKEPEKKKGSGCC